MQYLFIVFFSLLQVLVVCSCALLTSAQLGFGFSDGYLGTNFGAHGYQSVSGLSTRDPRANTGICYLHLLNKYNYIASMPYFNWLQYVYEVVCRCRKCGCHTQTYFFKFYWYIKRLPSSNKFSNKFL